MARPQLPASSSRPTYFGGTPTSSTGYNRPDLWDDPEWQAQNRPSGLDFSDEAIAERERLARERAIANLQASRQLVADAGPQGYVAPGIDVEGLGIGVETPATQAQQAYIAYTIALQGSRASNLLKYPTLAKAAIEAGIDQKDLARLVNYAEVDAAAERLLGSFALLYNEEGDEAKASLGQYQVDSILKSANPVMKAAIMDVLGEKIKELEAPGGSDSATWADTVIENAGKILEVVFTPFEMANQASQQAFRAAAYGSQVEQTNAAGPLGPIQNIWEYWDKVSDGNYDQKLLGAAKQEFGPLAVDLVLEVEKKTREGDPDPLISLFAEKSGDPEAMQLIADMLYGDGSEGVDFAEVSRAVDNAALFNTGQLFISSLVGTNGLGSVSRDKFANLTNVVATLALDPTIAGAKVRSAYIATRFALEKVAPGASRAGVAAAFNMRPTRRYFTKLFDDLDRYDELAARDPGAAGVLREQIRRQFPEIPDDTIELFITDGVRTVDALVDWTVETNAMFTMARGRSAAGMIAGGDEAAVVDPLAVAMAERGAALTRSQLLPRMGASYARRARQRFARMITPLTPQRRGKAVINEAYGDTPDPSVLAGAATNVDIATKAGALERGGMVSGVPGALGKKVDNTFKYFSSIGLGYVNIVDGRDARTIYRYARTYLSRRHAAYWADMWRKATPSQRYDMLIGLNRTTAAAKGLDLTDPEMLARVDELITPTATSRTSFSAKSPVLSQSNETVIAALMQERDVLAGITPEGDGVRATLGPEGVITRIQEIDDRIANLGKASSATPEAAVALGDTSIPSLFPDGSEKALFGWQTASHVALPNIAEVEKLGRWQRFVSEHGGTLGEAIINAPQRITDMWSLGTLFGLRFALRSAVEDWWFYAVITGGNLGDLYKGRRMSTMLREARGRTRATALSGGKKDVPALGMFNRRARAVGDQLENSQNEVARTIGSWIRGNLDPEDVAAAHAAALKGDFEPMRKMAALALAKSRVTFINEAEKGYFLDLVDGPFGMKLLDDLAEGGKNINSGGIADDALNVPGTEAAGVDVMAVPRTKDAARRGPTGEYTPELPVDGTRDEAFIYWERGIRGVLLGDGPAGRIAVAYLDDPEEAIRRVAAEIRNDPTGYGYSWRFAALRDESPESFAARKVQAVRGLFSDAQGNLNETLWRKVVKDDRSVVAYETAEDGTKTFNIDLGVLRSVPKDKRPAYVSGQEFGTIPVPNGLAPFLDRSWTWMGEQYARISREPIFLANYLSQRKQLAGVQAQLTAEIGDRAARRVVSRMAEDRAYTFTLSYMDNPQNRSLLAYKIRNVSRYYRATEDFYRRMMRAGKNYPVGFWKTALIYDVLDDTGFVYTDDNGDKYFMYPATSELMGAMNWALGKISGQDGMDMKFPFVLGGKVRMLAPSSDPNQVVASLAGPMGTFSYKLLARRFPSISRLNRLVLGEYGNTGQGSVIDDFSASFLPGQLQNLIRTLNDDEVDSMVAAAAKDALTIAVVNDLIPEDENSVEFTNAMAKIDLIAWSAVVTRMIFGFVAPASPQRLTTNISEYARLNRVIAPRPAFLKLVQKRADEGMENPVGAALADWWQLDQDMLPYTVSRTQDVKGGTRGLAELKTSLTVLDWFNENRTGIIEKYPTTAYFLAPQDEGFDWNTWNLIKAEGLRVPKAVLNPDGTPGAFLRDMFAAKGEFQHYATIADYQRDIDALDPRDPEQYKMIRDLEEQRSADLEYNRTQNPYWDMKYTQTRNFGDNQRNAERALTQTKRMVDELFESTSENEWEGSPAQAIRNAIYTYIDYANEIRATSGSDTDSEMKRRYLRIGLQEDMDYLASLNPNAKLFIRNVLMADPDIKVLDLELVGASSG